MKGDKTQLQKAKKSSKSNGEEAFDDENRRTGWTPGWGNSLDERERETLPIKMNGKVIRQKVIDRVTEPDTSADQPASGKDIYSSKVAKYSDADHSRKAGNKQEEQRNNQNNNNNNNNNSNKNKQSNKKAKTEPTKSKSKQHADADSDSDMDDHSAADEEAGGGSLVDEDEEEEEEGEGDYAFRPDFSEDKARHASDDEDDDEQGRGSGSGSDSDGDGHETNGKNAEKNREQRKARKEHKEKKLRKFAEDGSDDDDRPTRPAPAEKFVKGSQKQQRMNILGRLPVQELMQYIGNVCRGVLDSPERSLKRRAADKEALGGLEDNEDDRDYKLLDLFDVITAKSSSGESMFSEKIVEMAMLSMLLIFKDILPSYRIRPVADKTSGGVDVQLKKTTKHLRDYELGLLGAYQRFLKIISELATAGLGPVVLGKKARAHTATTDSQLGLSALRCQCELLQAAPHFNFRTSLLTAVVGRAAQRAGPVHAMACEALIGLFSKDRQGEASLEATKLMAITSGHVKFGNIPENFIRCLFHLRLEVRADEARALKAKAKRERRKRKRAEDDIAQQMAENSADNDKISSQKLQSNCLHEVSLIYFRIIKGHIGFGLLPVAMEGLSKISHLLNIDTMEEVVELMRGLLDKPEGTSGLPSPPVQLQCIACALRILSGPGEALGIDLHFFSARLALLMTQLPACFEHWDVVVECVTICASKRSNERTAPILNFVRILLHCAGHQQASIGAVTLLSAAHALLLRHPRVRARMLAIERGGGATAVEVGGKSAKRKVVLFDEDDEVCDAAMQPLQDGRDSLAGGKGSHDSVANGGSEDGSWALPLLRRHADPMIAHAVSFLTAKDINPLPLRAQDAHFSPMMLCDRAESALNAVSKNIERDVNRRSSSHNKSKNNGERKAVERKQEQYMEQIDKKWTSFEKSSKLSVVDIKSTLRALYKTKPGSMSELTA